jgi:preprotein translocase subunit SecD
MAKTKGLMKRLVIPVVGALALAAIIAALYWQVPQLGRELIGRRANTFLVYDVDVAHAYDPRLGPDDVVKQTAERMQQRLDGLDVFAVVKPRGRQVELAIAATGEPSLERIKRTVSRSARMVFRVVDDGSAFMQRLVARVATEAAEGVRVDHDTWQERDSGAAHNDFFLTARDRQLLLDTIAKQVASDPLAGDHEILLEERNRDGMREWRTYYVFKHDEITGEAISDAESTWDEQTQRPEAQLTFDAAGAQRFEQLTARAVGRKLAIVLEGQIQSAPVIESKIAGGHARITMGGYGDAQRLQDEAKMLIAILRYGSLAAPVTLASERSPKPSL